MTRSEIENDYEVKDGVICSPGKFEAEPIYAPYFYAALGDGGADEVRDEDGIDVHVFAVSDEDRQQFPELEGVQVLHCWESDVGFFYCQPA